MSRAVAKKKRARVPAVAPVRCAIYTRQSVTDGKGGEFSSLDAQRESAEAYARSQRGRGWTVLPALYDDGNVSGSTADRPALHRLLADVDAGEIDCVLVYKIDRLSRSIADFVRLMEHFEKRGVAFAAVTQQFDTTSSVGRLTLNLLTCFAQFERETIAERTRDKIHAARKRGRWTGGPPPLGYDVHPDGGRIVVNAVEADQVRATFALYEEIGTIIGTTRAVNERGWTTKAWTTRGGRERTGKRWTKVSVRALLTNPVYVGKVKLGDDVFDGQHARIIEPDLYDRVQARVARNAVPKLNGTASKPSRALLAGLLRCGPCNAAMSATHTTKRGRRYRYYVCRRTRSEGWAACPTKSVPAHEMERIVVDQIRVIGKDPKLVKEVVAQAKRECPDLKAGDLRRALALFDPVWDVLHAKERQRVLHLLISRVEYDAADGTVEFTFKPSGIAALAEEVEA